ncbi:MAG: hypothetical protein D6731_18410 [Planctomycetota bacterium]|nr:MAG: hypothetical protein D6731_18410 [Planctomycetota bacterium]
MTPRRVFFLAAAILALPAAAQPAPGHRAGLYAVRGDDPVRGSYTGRLELRWRGSEYSFVREVEFDRFRYRGHSVSLVWTGRAIDTPGGVAVEVELDRMGWALDALGLPARTAADGAPMPVRGDFVARGASLAGTYRGQGPPFGDPSETWTRVGAPGPQPIWRNERWLVPSHAPPSPLLKRLLFALFASYHALPAVRPYVPRPEFQAATYGFIRDRTDFALLRSRPDLLRLVDRLVDPLNLEEALVKTNAFGKPLRAKAAEADRELPRDFLNPTGCLSTLLPNGTFGEENDGALWTGVYCYSQALRFRSTQDPAALANLERTARSLWIMATISGRPDAFARTLRPSTGQPLGSLWARGTGRYAGIEWKRGGNNDMYKGLLLGGLAAREGLPAGHPLRAKLGTALRDLNAHHAVLRGTRRIGNRLLSNGVVAALLGPGPERDAYRRLVRNPLLMLYELVLGGGFHFQGISDWSGTHLEAVSLLMKVRLADLLQDRFASFFSRLVLRRAAKRLAKTRRALHLLAAAGLGNLPGRAPIDGSDGVWALRERPFPRSTLGEGHSLRRDYVLGPYPNLPWKRDWTTNPGRAVALVAPPFFEWGANNYFWKSTPYPALRPTPASRERNHSADIIFAYWLGRSLGVIGPND